MPDNNTEDKTAEVKPVTYNPSFFELADDGGKSFMFGPTKSDFSFWKKAVNMSRPTKWLKRHFLEDNILPGTENSLFDETVLHTPMIQEDQTDPMKKFFNK